MSESCRHEEREDGICRECGDCLHEVVLNGVCWFCGADEVKVTVKPVEPPGFVPLGRLKKG